MNVPTSSLRTAFARVVKLASGRISLPILSCVKLEAHEGKMSIHATDCTAYASSRCDCDGDLEPICVPAHAISALLSCATDTVKLTHEPSFRLRFESGNKSVIAGQDPEHFPVMADESSIAIGVNCEDMAMVIESVKWAAKDKNGDRYLLAGVNVTCTAKGISAVASDGYFVAYHNLPSIAAECEFLFPSEAAPMLCESLRMKEATLMLSPTHIQSVSPDFDVSCKLIEGKYYNIHNQILATKRADLGVIDKKLVLDALGTIKSLAQGTIGGYARAEFGFSQAGLKISYAGDNTFETVLEGERPDRDIPCNADYASRAIASCNSPAPKVSASDVMICFEAGGYLALLVFLRVKP